MVIARTDAMSATEAGYVEYSSLSGKIKTGCQLTPMPCSSYCYEHAPRISSTAPLPDPDTVTTTATDKKCDNGTKDVVHMILGKKITRRTTYYQVHREN